MLVTENVINLQNENKSYSLLNEPIDERWSNIGSLALPDGVHNRNKDLIYFHIPSIDQDQDSNKTLFGIASYRRIDANPVYGNISEELGRLTETYFEEKNFNQRQMFEDFVDNLNKNPPEFNLQYYSARDLVIRYRRKTFILFKLILLRKKVQILF
ncbi:unnamed protein product [Rotaria socialis]|uniref:AVL9/DENND6 domain-containing protein n=1 Tax=Rotaria socialis TaxID=392032 RepID=A0A820T020_9BILA|nr:unnamed protein product [Rotaria socialis]CAF4466822.1 unnamed protein product [Rotaria socialis]